MPAVGYINQAVSDNGINIGRIFRLQGTADGQLGTICQFQCFAVYHGERVAVRDRDDICKAIPAGQDIRDILLRHGGQLSTDTKAAVFAGETAVLRIQQVAHAGARPVVKDKRHAVCKRHVSGCERGLIVDEDALCGYSVEGQSAVQVDGCSNRHSVQRYGGASVNIDIVIRGDASARHCHLRLLNGKIGDIHNICVGQFNLCPVINVQTTTVYGICHCGIRSLQGAIHIQIVIRLIMKAGPFAQGHNGIFLNGACISRPVSSREYAADIIQRARVQAVYSDTCRFGRS